MVDGEAQEREKEERGKVSPSGEGRARRHGVEEKRAGGDEEAEEDQMAGSIGA